MSDTRRAMAGLLFGALCILLSAHPAVAQGGSRCTVTEVTYKQLSNAVLITVKADGLLESDINIMDFWEQEEGNWQLRQVEVVPFKLGNARSGVGSLITIDAYPVSHLKLNTSTGSREGVGLDCELVLYTRAIAGRIRTSGMRMGGRQVRGDVQVDMERSGDGTEFYITVLSDKHVDVADLAAAAPSEVTPELEVAINSAGRLDVKAVNSSIREALQQSAELASARLIIDDAVNTRLTCHLRDMALPELLDAIATGYGLAVARRDGGYYISEALPQGPAAYWLSETAIIPLRYLSPADALPLLPDYVLRFVKRHKDGNALVVTGSPGLIEKVRSDIERVDRPGLQMSVRAMLVEMSSIDANTRALQLLMAGGDTQWELNSEASSLRFAMLPDRLTEVSARLRALRRRGDVHLRVEPHMTVLSGQRAEFFFGSRQYFRFKNQTSAGTEVTIRSADVGVRLVVTPWGATREHITVPLTIEASNILSVGAGGLPTVARRRATATMVIAAGDTLIVGGLRSSSPTDTVQSTAPLLLPPPLRNMAEFRNREVTERDALVLLQVEANNRPPAGTPQDTHGEETP
ncbi:MAG TPA: hypothetical protein DGT21_20780 [Armatimonadetes bacterium]|jgi:hypothetical protein|nr:hypothetical protein [Armatimonadota bacterium]